MECLHTQKSSISICFFFFETWVLIMAHLLEIVKGTKENCRKGLLMQKFRNGQEGFFFFFF